MQQFGFEGRTLLYTLDGEPRLVGGTWSEAEAVLRRADVVLNFHYAIDPRLLTYARRTALVDIDPGLLQFWMSTGQLNVPAHDCYLTTGETVGTPAARFSDCGLQWTHIRPPVCLDLWPVTDDARAEDFTTVSSWSSASWLKVNRDGQSILIDNTKRVSFLDFVDLPRHTSQPLELALYLLDRDPGGPVRVKQAQQDAADRASLQRHGWRVASGRGCGPRCAAPRRGAGGSKAPHGAPPPRQYRGVPQRRGSPLGLPQLGPGAQGARLPSDLARGHRCRRQRHVSCGPPPQAPWPCCRLRRDPHDAPGALPAGCHARGLRDV